MGFFDTITDTTSSTASTSPDIIIDETVAASSSDTPAVTVTNSVGEIFETTKEGISFVSENEPPNSRPTAEISFIQDASELNPNSEVSSATQTLEITDAPKSIDTIEIADKPDSDIVLNTTGILEISEVPDTTSVPETTEGVSFDEPAQHEPASQASEISFLPSLAENVARESHVTPLVETASISSATPLAQEQSVEEEYIDVDSTIRRAIAELVANASKIQLKVDAALEEETRLLEEISQQKKAHEIAIAALNKAAEAARKTADEIKKSGERTQELRELLEDQLA